MDMDTTQSPEADLDRQIEELIGKKLRGMFDAGDMIRLFDLQDRRSRLLRPNPRGRNAAHALGRLYA